MKFLRQSTSVTVVVGPFPDKTTALPVTSLTDQSANGRLVKNGTGGAITATSWAHDAQGTYLVGLSTSHTDTIGRLRLSFSDPTTYLPVWEDFTVLHANVYDWLFGSTAPSTYAGGAVASVTGPVASVTAAVTVGTNNDKTGYALTSGEHTAVAADVWDALRSAHTVANSFGAGVIVQTVNDKTGYTASTVGDKTGYALTSGEHTAISADVWDAARSGHTGAGSFGQGVASVQGNVTGSVGSVTGAVGSVTSNVTVGGYAAGQDPATVLFAAALPGTPTAGTAGEALKFADTRLDAAVSTRSTYAGGDTAGTTTLLGRLTAGRATNLDNLDAAVSTRSTLTAAGVWDLSIAGHTTGGTTGGALNAAGSAGDPWATPLPGAYSAGTAGAILGTNLDATVSSRSTYAGADTPGTGTLLGRLTSGRATNLDNLDAAVSSRLATAGYTAPPDTAAIDAALSATHGAGAWDAAGLTGADVQAALTAQGYTAGRAAGLDNLDAAVSGVASAVTVAGYAAGQDPASLLAGGVALAAAERAAVADRLLGRSIAGGADGGRTVRDALRFLRNRWEIAAGVLTVYAEDDATLSHTMTITTDAAAAPVTSLDPS